MVDSNDRDRVDAARDELHRMLNEDELRESILLVFANKQVCCAAYVCELNCEQMRGRQCRRFTLEILEAVMTFDPTL